MHKPEMILFDYGHTLASEPGEWDYLRAEEAVFEHIINNPKGVTPKQINDFSIDLFNKYEKFREQGFEPSALQSLKYKYGYFNLEFDISYEEIQKVLWDSLCKSVPMPRIESLLEYLKNNNIRTGVISNIGWTGSALKNRLDEVMPDNNFEFIIASSDYCFRKPDKMLFELALSKAGLKADKVWYCGDNMNKDIIGAHNAEIFPVLYENKEIPNPWYETADTASVNFDFLHIYSWNSLIEILKKCDE